MNLGIKCYYSDQVAFCFQNTKYFIVNNYGCGPMVNFKTMIIGREQL